MQCRAMVAAAHERIIEFVISQLSEDRARSLHPHLQYYREFDRYQFQRLLTYVSGTRTERLQAAFRDYRQGLYQAWGRQGAREAIANLVCQGSPTDAGGPIEPAESIRPPTAGHRHGSGRRGVQGAGRERPGTGFLRKVQCQRTTEPRQFDQIAEVPAR